MNENILLSLFPDHFKTKTVKGILIYVLGTFTALLAFIELVSLFMSVMQLLWLEMFFSALGLVLFTFITRAFFRVAQASLNPLEKSRSIWDIKKAKALFDNGTLDKENQFNSAAVSIDFSNYSLFTLINIYGYIDKTSYPDNYSSLCLHIKNEITELTGQGVFS